MLRPDFPKQNFQKFRKKKSRSSTLKLQEVPDREVKKFPKRTVIILMGIKLKIAILIHLSIYRTALKWRER